MATPSLTKHIWLYWPNEDLEYVLEYVLRKLRKGFSMALLGSHHKHRSRQHCPQLKTLQVGGDFANLLESLKLVTVLSDVREASFQGTEVTVTEACFLPLHWDF